MKGPWPCDKCGGRTLVIDVRTPDWGLPRRKRRRACDECGHRFNTIELLEDVYEHERADKRDRFNAGYAAGILAAKQAVDEVAETKPKK